MSGVLSIPNTFQNAVTATGLQLDQDFNTITAYANDPTNRNNFATDIGNTNTIALSFSPPVVGGYTTGLDIMWKQAITNSGAMVVNANTLGNVSLVNVDGSAMLGGQLPAGTVGHGAYDGTRVINLTPPYPATKAQMQTATASASFISPAQAVNHPGVSKAWVAFNGTTTGTQTVGTNGFNVTSIIRTGTGSYSITFTNPLGVFPYPITGTGNYNANVYLNNAVASNTATANVIVAAANTGTPADATYVTFITFGTNP